MKPTVQLYLACELVDISLRADGTNGYLSPEVHTFSSLIPGGFESKIDVQLNFYDVARCNMLDPVCGPPTCNDVMMGLGTGSSRGQVPNLIDALNLRQIKLVSC